MWKQSCGFSDVITLLRQAHRFQMSHIGNTFHDKFPEKHLSILHLMKLNTGACFYMWKHAFYSCLLSKCSIVKISPLGAKHWRKAWTFKEYKLLGWPGAVGTWCGTRQESVGKLQNINNRFPSRRPEIGNTQIYCTHLSVSVRIKLILLF